MKPTIHFENIEGNPNFTVPTWGFQRRKRPGISAFVRIKNGADYLAEAVESILSTTNEIVLSVQGGQDDQSAVIAEQLAGRFEKVRVIYYPFDNFAIGPGHDENPKGSIFERAYYTNWTLAQTTCQWALEWSPDMVATPSGLRTLRKLTGNQYDYDAISFCGERLVGADLTRYSVEPLTPRRARLFQVAPQTFYATGRFGPGLCAKWDREKKVEEPLYMDVRWSKPLEKATDDWPEAWAAHTDPSVRAYFKAWALQRHAGDHYEGELPLQLRKRVRDK